MGTTADNNQTPQDNPFDFLGNLDDVPTLEALAAQWNITLPTEADTSLDAPITVEPADLGVSVVLEPEAPVVVPETVPVAAPAPRPPAPSAQSLPSISPAPAPAPPAYTPPAPAPSKPVVSPQPASTFIPDDDDDDEEDAEVSPLNAVLRLRRRINSTKDEERLRTEEGSHSTPRPAQEQARQQESLNKLPVIESAPKRKVVMEAPRTRPEQPKPAPAPAPAPAPKPKEESDSTGIIRIETRRSRQKEEEDYGPPRLITGSPIGDESFEEAIFRRRKERHDKRVRIAVACAVLAAIVLIAGVYQFTKGNVDAVAAAQADIETYEVIRRDFVKVVEASGSLAPVSSTELTAEVDGIIEAVNVTEGTSVHAGDVLITIHNEALAKELQEANDKLAAANDTLLVATNQLNEAKANYESAKAAYETAYANYRQQIANAQATGAPINGLTPPTWSEQSYQSIVSATQTTFDQASAAQQAAQKNRDDVQSRADKRNVIAPVDGTVVGLNAQVGQNVLTVTTGGQPTVLLQVADLSSLVVKVQVSESDVTKLAPGMLANVTFGALPDYVAEGTINSIGSTASVYSQPKDAESSDAASQGVKYDVTVLIQYPDWLLRPGMSATMRVTVETLPSSLVVPRTAVVTEDNGDSYVILVHKDLGGIGILGTSNASATTEKHTVTIDSQDNDYAAVSGHIAEGDVIALDAKSLS